MAGHKRELKQWSRTAGAIGLLFASMPAAGRILLGAWEFRQAAAISIICFFIAGYLYIRSHRERPAIPDGAALLERALQMSTSGKPAKAISLLTKALLLDPKLWQAFQYRGQLRASEGDYRGALEDFSDAIRLAPQERHLHLLRAQVRGMAGEDTDN